MFSHLEPSVLSIPDCKNISPRTYSSKAVAKTLDIWILDWWKYYETYIKKQPWVHKYRTSQTAYKYGRQ
jgi:hypothetical protein